MKKKKTGQTTHKDKKTHQKGILGFLERIRNQTNWLKRIKNK
jgi:hypothetical protein